MILKLALLALLVLGITLIGSTVKLAKTSHPKQRKQKRTKPPASWHKTSHRSKQKHKVYVAPVIQRKWRTPRRSSH
jgi:Na+-transporting methylmalonyl-CoA/oxaloacetate decarboxylase gamma subunit